jgi:hypothetical protein
MEVNDISFLLMKSEENRDLVPQQFATKMRVQYPSDNHTPLPKLFGTAIMTGPVVMEADVEINDLATVLQNFRDAAIGTGVRVSTKPLTPVRFLLLPKQANDGVRVTA